MTSYSQEIGNNLIKAGFLDYDTLYHNGDTILGFREGKRFDTCKIKYMKKEPLNRKEVKSRIQEWLKTKSNKIEECNMQEIEFRPYKDGKPVELPPPFATVEGFFEWADDPEFVWYLHVTEPNQTPEDVDLEIQLMTKNIKTPNKKRKKK